MIDPLTLITLVIIPVYLLGAALIAFLLYWVVRLGVRGGLRDHHKWVTQPAAPPSPAGETQNTQPPVHPVA
ncbi:hypothetical protein [Herbiconiux sp. UC225_62]|uniref:hypothetical protein n=1 Tax=Herbiconiux sp. UC225_62 TaxID=3350168 RepID=UPI0036D21208